MLKLENILNKLDEVGIYKRDAKAFVQIYNDCKNDLEFIEEAYQQGYAKTDSKLFLKVVNDK